MQFEINKLLERVNCIKSRDKSLILNELKAIDQSNLNRTTSYARLIKKEDFIIKDLLPFIMQSDKFFDWAIKYSAGSMTPRTKFESLKKLELSIPPKEYQKKILKNLKKIQKLSLETKNIYLDSLNLGGIKIESFILLLKSF